ncbi:hypothetical protein MRS44_009072 [Fusarium solani]|uniref:Uncharacterized protein n=1 Tax=Fusarium solani TaxID=169388 RepID=A0A9P9HPZ1_FUSSL|nr:uncharacterized protein B0J15DRAFT_548033 [Fusarium solani]KAH7260439.1 hypothetical protein B0J15DRAFT_548033 [Fusarium solani]KAJ3464286.1 hypothetical protein MRS44_009072 [Fusarium solani]
MEPVMEDKQQLGPCSVWSRGLRPQLFFGFRGRCSSSPSTAAAAPAPAPAHVAAPAPIVPAPAPAPAPVPAPAPTANAAGGRHQLPHCHKMGTHRPEECRSAPQNIFMAGVNITNISFGPGATAADLAAVLSRMRQQAPPARPQAGVKKSRRRRGRKPGQRAKDAGRKPEDKDPGEGGAGCGGGMVPA